MGLKERLLRKVRHLLTNTSTKTRKPSIINRVRLGTILCIFIFFCACESKERDPLTNAGMRHFLAERYSEAIATFHQALAVNEDDYEIYHYLARYYLGLGKFPQALRVIEHAIELAPPQAETRAELYEVLGAIHTARYTSRAYSQNQYEDAAAALAAFEKSTQLDPQRATAHYNRGLLHGYRKEVDQAQAAYTAALKADSTLAPVYKKLGKIHREKGFPPEAARAFKKAVHFDPKNAEAHFLLGLAYRDMNDNTAALEALLMASELTPDSPKIRLNLGNAYLRLGRREEGKEEMERSQSLRQRRSGLHSEISPPAGSYLPIGSARDHYNMGLKHHMANEIDKAILEFRRAVEIKPDHKDANIGLGLLLSEQGRPKQAARYLQQALTIDSENPVLYIHLGNAHWQSAEFTMAGEAFSQAVQLDTTRAEPYYKLGLIAAHRGKLKEAIELFTKTTDIVPHYAHAYLNLGVGYMKLEKFAAARSAYKRFVELEPDDGRGHLYLGDTCEKLGLLEESQTHRARARELFEKKRTAKDL